MTHITKPILAVVLLATIGVGAVDSQGPVVTMRQPAVAGMLHRYAAGQSAQSKPATQTRTERTLLRLEDEWARAVVRRDAAAFRRLLSTRFVYTENERVMGKEELIREVTSGSDTVESAGNEDMKAYVYGTTGVVTGVLVLKGRGKDGSFSRRFRYTDTWVYRGGRWQVVAAQDYLLPE